MERGQLFNEIESLDISNDFKDFLRHLIYFIDDENGKSTVYSTDSIFWYKFYRGGSE